MSCTVSLELVFQFTHPGRGATGIFQLRYRWLAVSIHAPREGCDAYILFGLMMLLLFQFTHPGRGATIKPSSPSLKIGRFNSRTPGGVRPRSSIGGQSTSVFQFTHPGRGATVLSSEVSQADKVSIHAPREGCDGRFFFGITSV